MELPKKYAFDPLLTFNNFIAIKNSDRIMVIEDIKPSTDEDKSSLLVKGRASEILLDRRVLTDPIDVRGEVEYLIFEIMLDNVTDPADTERTISLINIGSPHALNLTAYFEDQLKLQTVYEAIKLMTKATNYGFKTYNYNGTLYFVVFEGVDRSTSQSEVPPVFFAEGYDNVISSSFYSTIKEKTNVVLVATDDTVYDRTYIWNEVSEPTDIDRFESILETDIDRDLGSTSLTDSEVLAIITTRGEKELDEKKLVDMFEGEFDIVGVFKYNKDFFIGDLIQCYLEGQNVKARVIEVVRSYSSEGEKIYVGLDYNV